MIWDGFLTHFGFIFCSISNTFRCHFRYPILIDFKCDCLLVLAPKTDLRRPQNETKEALRALLGRSWSLLGPLGSSSGHLGLILDPPGPLLGLFGPPRRVQDTLGTDFGHTLDHQGSILDPSRLIQWPISAMGMGMGLGMGILYKSERSEERFL